MTEHKGAMLLVEDGATVNMSGQELQIGRKPPQNRSTYQMDNSGLTDGKPPRMDLTALDLRAGTMIPPPLLGLPTI